MKVVVVASQKGGAGKTTLSAHVACAAPGSILLDADPQGSLREWWEAREAEEPPMLSGTVETLPEAIEAARGAGYQVMVIDTPPGVGDALAQIVAAADFVLIPVRPSPHDFRAVDATAGLCRSAGKPFAFVVNAAKARTQLKAAARGALEPSGAVAPVEVIDRVVFAESMIEGKTAGEVEPDGAAAGEIKSLWEWLSSEMGRA